MRRRRHSYSQKSAAFQLNLTSMVDMFTIMLVYLLNSFAVSASHITPAQGLTLPVSSSKATSTDFLKLVVSQNGIFVEEKKVADITDGKITLSALDKEDPDFVRPLFEELDELYKKIEEANKSQSLEGENNELGKVILQADAKLSYSVLKKIMYTASMAGFTDVKLAMLSGE